MLNIEIQNNVVFQTIISKWKAQLQHVFLFSKSIWFDYVYILFCEAHSFAFIKHFYFPSL